MLLKLRFFMIRYPEILFYKTVTTLKKYPLPPFIQVLYLAVTNKKHALSSPESRFS